MKAFFAKAPDAELSVTLSGCRSLTPNQTIVKGDAGEKKDALLARAKRIAGDARCDTPTKVESLPKKGGVQMDGLCGEMNSRGDDHPVVCVDQKEAEDFCASEGAALPTEVDIVNASRGASGTDEFGTPIDKAVIYENRKDKENDDNLGTEAVCGKDNERESDLGLCDLAGNTWERTSTIENGLVVFKGGSFSNLRRYARAALRYYVSPDYRNDNGFRCARQLP